MDSQIHGDLTSRQKTRAMVEEYTASPHPLPKSFRWQRYFYWETVNIFRRPRSPFAATRTFVLGGIVDFSWMFRRPRPPVHIVRLLLYIGGIVHDYITIENHPDPLKA